MSKSNKSRRKFLSIGLLGAAGAISGEANANTPGDESEKIKMLTPDGQLVEIDKNILDKVSDRKQIKNKDLLDWSKSIK